MASYSDYVICLDNGHGETKSNGSPYSMHGIPPALEYKEYAYAREIVKRLSKKLLEEGFGVFIVVPELADIGLGTRVSRIRKRIKQDTSKQYLSISVHSNGVGTGMKWYGNNTWGCYVSEGTRNLSNSIKLAGELYKAAEKAGLKTYASHKDARGYKYEAKPLSMTQVGDCPSVLTENLFHTNIENVKFLNSEEGKNTIVNIHVNAIKQYIGAVTPTVVKTTQEEEKEEKEETEESNTVSDSNSCKVTIEYKSEYSGMYSYSIYDGGKYISSGFTASTPNYLQNETGEKLWKDAVAAFNKQNDSTGEIKEVEENVDASKEDSEKQEDGDNSLYKTASEGASGKIETPQSKVRETVETTKNEASEKILGTFDPTSLLGQYASPVQGAINKFNTEYEDEYLANHERFEREHNDIVNELNKEDNDSDEATAVGQTDEQSQWEAEAKIINLPEKDKKFLQVLRAQKLVKKSSRVLSKGKQADAKSAKNVVKSLDRMEKSSLFSTPDGKMLITMLSALVTLLCAFVAAMIAMRKLEAKEAEIEEEAAEKENPNIDEVARKLASTGLVVDSYASEGINGFSKTKTSNSAGINSSESGSSASGVNLHSKSLGCCISLCDPGETPVDIEGILDDFGIEAPEKLVIEFDKDSSREIYISEGSIVKCNDIIGTISGQPVTSPYDFEVTEISENYIIGKYVID